MKLVFKKDEKSQISVFQNVDGQESNFSYLDMIKSLIESKAMEDAGVSDKFTDAEAESIKRMVDSINDEIAETLSQ